MIIPNICKHKKCSKPPTRIVHDHPRVLLPWLPTRNDHARNVWWTAEISWDPQWIAVQPWGSGRGCGRKGPRGCAGWGGWGGWGGWELWDVCGGFQSWGFPQLAGCFGKKPSINIHGSYGYIYIIIYIYIYGFPKMGIPQKWLVYNEQSHL